MSITWSESAIQYALATTFDWFRVLCVPNVMSGYGTESDFMMVTKAGLLWECEIKISRQDWKSDAKKNRRYMPDYNPARFYYAVTNLLLADGIPEWVAPDAGILELYDDGNRPRCIMRRQAKARHRIKVSDKTRIELLSKVHYRYWRHVAPIKAETDKRLLIPDARP